MGLLGLLKLRNILRLDRVDSSLSSSQERNSLLQITIRDISFSLDLVSLGFTSLCYNSNFVCLGLGFLVLDLKLLEELLSEVRGILKFDVLLFELNLELFNTSRGLGKTLKTLYNALTLNINCLVLCLVKTLIHVNERKVGLGCYIHMASQFLEVFESDLMHEVMDTSHVTLELALHFTCAVYLK